ncbi:uncharacterized protein cubi_00615 [Cryptosporidium ubiquitum]|uniref:Uncharacterized protein n=1 Tax=Cryptosporidium ubiquitum TaxID=857276 RepID=A0A1J4MCV5_9CRYT|nr:uncharacterized protein cubi_00615 [Cryptosporidium ubiquitum]OII71807.1 hypothetical protein cubi_00615 [Cryptosporidium ubiquitum]
MNNVYDHNVESLWWSSIFESFIRDKINTFIRSDVVLNKDLVTFVPSTHQINNFEIIDQLNDFYFVCQCKKCHKITYNDAIPVSNSPRYRIVCRMVASVFNRFKSLYYDGEINILSEEDIHFLINKILINNYNISEALKKIPVSSYYNF